MIFVITSAGGSTPGPTLCNHLTVIGAGAADRTMGSEQRGAAENKVRKKSTFLYRNCPPEFLCLPLLYRHVGSSSEIYGPA